MVASGDKGGPVGSRLHYRTFGSGPALIVLHGFLGASGNWQSLASKVFGDHFTTYTVDQRNHGRSPHTEAIDYALLAQDLRAFMDAHDLERAHVLGHSMGGKVAMQFALTDPDRVDRLVIVDIAPRAYPPEHRPLLDALQQVDFSAVDSRSDVDRQLASSIRSKPVRQFLMKNLGLDATTKQYTWDINLETLAREYDGLTGPISSDQSHSGATLFVRGARSDYVTAGDEQAIRSLFPSARIETIEGAGHWVHADAPQDFARAVLGFLQEPQ